MSRRTRREILEERLSADQIKAVYMLLDNELAAEGDKLTQDEIAEACNVHRATLYRWRTQDQDFIDYRREVMQNYISDMSGLFLKSLRKSIVGTNGTPSMKALDLFAKIEGLVDNTNKVDVNIGSGGRSNDDLENELAELEKQLEAMGDEEGEN